MTPSPVTIRRWTAETGKTGWRWACRICPPVRPSHEGTGGRPRGGFHWDDHFTFARMRTHPGAWNACVQAALLHVHVHHQGPPPTRPITILPTGRNP